MVDARRRGWTSDRPLVFNRPGITKATNCNGGTFSIKVSLVRRDSKPFSVKFLLSARINKDAPPRRIAKLEEQLWKGKFCLPARFRVNHRRTWKERRILNNNCDTWGGKTTTKERERERERCFATENSTVTF